MADVIFDLGQFRGIAVRGGGSRVDKALHLLIAGGEHHVQEAVDIAAVGEHGIVNGTRNGTESGLVQNVIHSPADLVAGVKIADVAFHKGEILPGFLADQGFHHVQILLITGEEVIEANDFLSEPEQTLDKIGTDKAGAARDEPAGRLFLHFRAQLFVFGHSYILA